MELDAELRRILDFFDRFLVAVAPCHKLVGEPFCGSFISVIYVRLPHRLSIL